MQRNEQILHRLLFLSRWLATPFLIGLLCCLILLIYRFFADLLELAIQLRSTGWHDLIVGVLNLIDIALVANLVLIVVFSAYENFIRTMATEAPRASPHGLVDVDFGALKQKLLGSILAIAAIDALAWYLDLEKMVDTSKLWWAIGFPLMFAVAMLMLSVADRVGHRPDKSPPSP